MKLYMHPISTAARPVRLLIAENGIKCDEEMVDILKGDHYQEPYASISPNRLVPMLEDGDLRLTEGSAILKYLAEKYDLPSYPKDLKKRAKINEMMDWLPSFIGTLVTGWSTLSSFRTTSAVVMRRMPVPSLGDSKAPKIGCRFSTTTGLGRKINISATMNLALPTISALASYRSGN